MLTFVMLNKLRCHAHIIFSQSDFLIQIVNINSHTQRQTVRRCLYVTQLSGSVKNLKTETANSADPDQLASEEERSILFAKARKIRV